MGTKVADNYGTDIDTRVKLFTHSRRSKTLCSDTEATKSKYLKRTQPTNTSRKVIDVVLRYSCQYACNWIQRSPTAKSLALQPISVPLVLQESMTKAMKNDETNFLRSSKRISGKTSMELKESRCVTLKTTDSCPESSKWRSRSRRVFLEHCQPPSFTK